MFDPEQQSQIDLLKFRFGEMEQFVRDQLAKFKGKSGVPIPGPGGPPGPAGRDGAPGIHLQDAIAAANDFIEKRLQDFYDGLDGLIIHILQRRGVLDLAGKAVPGPAGRDGKDSTIPGPKGDSIVGPAGKDGVDGKSIIRPIGPTGRDGLGGKDSIIPGPKGDSIVGPKGDSIVGPAGKNGRYSKDVQIFIGRVVSGTESKAEIRIENGIHYLDLVLQPGRE